MLPAYMLKFERNDWNEASPSISRILNGDITGVVLDNAVPPVETERFKNAISTLKNRFVTDLNNGNGFSLPAMFGQLHKSQPVELVDEYFNAIDDFCNSGNRECGFDVGA